MEYNFDTVVNRRGTNSVKWDAVRDEEVIPMWVADMDFPTAPCVTEALERRVRHGIYGYTRVPGEYYAATVDWFRTRHQCTIERDWILYTSGVVPALSAVIKALTQPGDKVLLQTPVYNCFFSSIRNNGCEVATSPLRYEDGTYHMDFDDLSRRVADPAVKVFLLCNPHNPAGRVWTEAELRRVGEICFAAGVTVISDEIHCELVFAPHRHICFASLGPEFAERSVTCCSPSKAFNIAGLQIANIFVKDEALRRAVDRALNINEVCDVNPFGVLALIAAYREGAPWLDALNAYLWDNYLALCDFFREHLPSLPVTRLEGTYLVWVDCRSLCLSSDELKRRLLIDGKVWINPGSMYGADGEGFIRINIACPRSQMLLGLERIAQCFDRISAQPQSAATK